ncbi:MAG: SusC/RagA family TonB-linked outer membrane protein, partial [Ferruginibacter sp.]|nr:SusC/RagA family TonB-linked outer membrane protein [Ferruginibacter sp.]
MNLTFIFLFAICLSANANGFSQHVSLSEKNVSLEKIFKEINRQTNYTFVYTESLLKKSQDITITVDNATIEQVLEICFKGQPLSYNILNKMVIIKEKEFTLQKTIVFSPPLPPAIDVTGKVTNNNGEPLVGVNVMIKGTSIGKMTDAEGKFSISVPSQKSILVISHTGYASKEISVGSMTEINVRLMERPLALNEVVVVGYGTQQKKSVVGAISSVKATEIEKSVVPSFESALQGRVAGLQVTQSSGVPGGLVTVRLRGTTSINAASEPLYILDGIPINSGGRGDAGGGISGNFGSSNNVLADINPNDIASIEVLKDASSTAIFGARGGAGVIIITTKKGQAGKTKLNAGYSYGVTKETNRVAYLDGGQYLSLLDEAFKNSGYPGNGGVPGPAPLPVRPQFSRAIADVTNSDHLSTVLRQGTRQEAIVSASGGSDKTNFYIGGTYYKEDGIIKGNDYEKVAFRSSIDNKATDKIKIGTSFNISYTTDYRMGSGTNTNAGGFGLAQTLIPVYPYYNADGSYFDPYNNGLGQQGRIGRNLVMFQDRNQFYSRQKKLRTIGNAYLEYSPLKGLVFRSDFGLDIYTQAIENYYSKYLRTISSGASVPVKATTGPLSPGQPGAESRNERVSLNNYNLNNTLTYSKTFAVDHSFKLLGGITYNRNNSPFLAVTGEAYPNDIFRDPSQATYKSTPSASNSDKYLFLAYFGRLNYSYKQKYLLELSYRREGSSRFGKGNKFGDFPAIGAGWIVSDEEFLKNVSFIDLLKVRSSYGLTGSTGGIQNFQSYNQWKNAQSDNLGSYKGNPYFFSEQVANPDLRWEKQTQFDIGLEFKIFNNRLSGTVD